MLIPLRIKLILAIVIPVLVIIGSLLFVSLGRRNAELEAKTTEELQSVAAQKAIQIELALQGIAAIATSTADVVEINPSLSSAQIYEQLRRNIRQNSAIYGSALAFEPNTFSGYKLFSPYARRVQQTPTNYQQLKVLDIATVYDYTKWQWYSEPKRSGKGIWVKPYFDEGAGNIMMSTFALPFHREGKVRGVATVDIDLSNLDNLFKSASPAKSEIFHYRAGWHLHLPS